MNPHAVQFKLGAHQFLWKSHWSDADQGILDTARKLGCEVFEISLGDDVEFDRRRLRREAEALGLELTVGPGNQWPQECNISADDEQHRPADFLTRRGNTRLWLLDPDGRVLAPLARGYRHSSHSAVWGR